MKFWSVYIVECSDGSLYTGIAIDIVSRIEKHNLGKGSKFVRGKLPVNLVHVEKLDSHSLALRREAEIKRLSRIEKLKLMQK